MVMMVALDRIEDNPYQPRQEYPEVEELAAKVLALRGKLPETLGLIHPPNGRLVDEDGEQVHFPGALPGDDEDWRVQIAEGHRRLRAFRLLAERDAAYGEMPVAVADFNDQAMDDIAWDENADRRDLSAVEEARALQRSMEKFGLSQKALAERRKLARSTISNKVRLLSLPEDLLEAIHEGRLTERHGVAFLPVLAINAGDVKEAKLSHDVNFTWQTPTPDTLRERLVTKGDLTADDVRKKVNTIEQQVELAKKRKWEASQRDEGRKTKDEGPGVAASPSPPAPLPRGEGSPVTAPPAPQKLEMPDKETLVPDLPEVVVTIRFARGKERVPGRFTLSAAEEGTFPEMFNGEYPGELREVLDHACLLFFPVGNGAEGEQILMEIEA